MYNNMEKREVFLEKNKSTVSVNKESELSVSLSAKTRVLPYSDINEKLSLIKLYNSERDACNRYRMIFTVNPICTNVLFNAKTEVIRKEGAPDCSVLPVETGVTKNISGETMGFQNLLSIFSANTLQAIRDTEYTHPDFFDGETPYVYHCGWDVFNNHMLRNDDFTYISKINGKSNEFNTISDYLRDKDGNIIKEKINPNNLIETEMHVYGVDNILSMHTAFRNRLDEKNGWYGFTNPGNIEISNIVVDDSEISINKMMNNNKSCELYELYPDQSLYSFIPKINKYRGRLEYNWDYDLVYPYENEYDKLKEIVGTYNKIAEDSTPIKIISAKKISSTSGNDFVCFKTLFKHTLKSGDYVKLYFVDGNSISSINRRFKVTNCGDAEGNDTDRYFSVLASDMSNRFKFVDDTVVFTSNNQDVQFFYKKDVSGTECKYYIRKFKRLKNERFESEINKLAFGENIYGDRMAQIIFTDDIDVEGLVDNLGRPLSEVYLYMFKTNRGHDEWYNRNNYTGETVEFSHCFGKITSGLDLPEEEKDYNVRKLHNVNFVSQARATDTIPVEYLNGFKYVYSGSIITESEQPKVIDDDLTIEKLDNGGFVYGDIVEFDPINYTETVIENIYHRFNTAQRESSNSKYFDVIDDEIEYDDYDIGVNTQANAFKVSAHTLNIVLDDRAQYKYPANIAPEGYFYNPKTAIKLADISGEITKVTVKQIKYSGWSGSDAFRRVDEGIDEEGNQVITWHGNFSALTKYDFVKGDFIALYQSESDKIFYGVVDNVIDNVIDVMFPEMPTAQEVVKGSAALLTTREYIAPYATFLPSSRAFVWRNLIKPSELPNDSTLYDMPFSNGCFYIHQNVNFFLKRQDPRNEFGLLYPENANDNVKPETKNYKKPGNNWIDLSMFKLFPSELKNICY